MSIDELKLEALTNKIENDLDIKYKSEVNKIRQQVEKEFDVVIKQELQFFQEKINEYEIVFGDITKKLEKYGCHQPLGIRTFKKESAQSMVDNIISKLVQDKIAQSGLRSPNRQEIRDSVIIKMMDTQSPQTIIDHVTKQYYD